MIVLVGKLRKEGWTATEIAEHLGRDADEVLRLTQAVGLPELFKNHEYSKSWEVSE